MSQSTVNVNNLATLASGSVVLASDSIKILTPNAFMSLGSKTATGVSSLDFNTSGANVPYDTRIQGSAGSGAGSDGTLTFLCGTAVIFATSTAAVNTPVFRPTSDNVTTLGSNSIRWSTVYAYNLKLQPIAVASLQSAATVGSGTRAFVNNATAATFGTVVAGGGANQVPVYSDGTNWRIG